MSDRNWLTERLCIMWYSLTRWLHHHWYACEHIGCDWAPTNFYHDRCMRCGREK